MNILYCVRKSHNPSSFFCVLRHLVTVNDVLPLMLTEWSWSSRRMRSKSVSVFQFVVSSTSFIDFFNFTKCWIRRDQRTLFNGSPKLRCVLLYFRGHRSGRYFVYVHMSENIASILKHLPRTNLPPATPTHKNSFSIFPLSSNTHNSIGVTYSYTKFATTTIISFRYLKRKRPRKCPHKPVKIAMLWQLVFHLFGALCATYETSCTQQFIYPVVMIMNVGRFVWRRINSKTALITYHHKDPLHSDRRWWGIALCT